MTPQPDTATDIPHDTFPTSTTAAPPRRRRPSRAARSPSLTRSSKRSPSPIVSFTPSAENAKGVKNITRKVIKTLEGLGHLDVVDMATYEEGDEEERRVDREVEEVLYELEREEIRSAGAIPETNGHSHLTTVNGNGAVNGGPVDKTKKLDLEIPRKVLHASIGFFTLYLYVSDSDVRKITLVLWTALAIIVPADLLRFRSQRFERTYERFLGFLMRESEKNSVNGVVWYILGVNFVLSLYPQDVATVAILILSWADTAASTFGRLYGSSTRKLPARLPILRIPLAPRKSLAGFTAASITGALIAVGFWSLVAPFRNGGRDVTWALEGGVRAAGHGGGWAALAIIGLVAGVVSGVAEALDLGSLDDNLTLPIISGGCILGFLKLLGIVTSWFS